jgi:probable rRNA maturation factor
MISFQFQIATVLKERNRLKAFLKEIFLKEGKAGGAISYIFCSDEFLLDINKRFLNHDYYTDIITFNLSSPGKAINGEVYISTDRVKENALNFDQFFNTELHRVIFHGILHLCGYKDKTQEEQRVMRKKEDEYLGLYFKE